MGEDVDGAHKGGIEKPGESSPWGLSDLFLDMLAYPTTWIRKGLPLCTGQLNG